MSDIASLSSWMRFPEVADVRSLNREDIIRILELPEGEALKVLFETADAVRKHAVGDEVFLRGIIEFSNICVRNCLYCGLRKSNSRVRRYRMEDSEIIETAKQIKSAGIETVVLQSGEDPFFNRNRLRHLIGRIRDETGLTVTLSVGERPSADYRAFREAGAERYLLKYETSSPMLYQRLRPGADLKDRLRCLSVLADLGYEVGSGNMVGLPGQTVETLAEDLLMMKEVNADMLGIGPFIPHPETPLASEPAGSMALTLKVIAVARILTGNTNIPATTAVGTISADGRCRALETGANVVMPDFTPPQYRRCYEIYPGRTDHENIVPVLKALQEDITRLGRTIGRGKGARKKNLRV